MASILFLAHRVPFPPDKGDKIRAFHILKHLAARHAVRLGTLARDAVEAAGLAALSPSLRGAHCGILGAPARAVRLALGALGGRPLSVAGFFDAGLERWVARQLAEDPPDLVFVYSSAMAQYVLGGRARGPLITDFVDADAEKWREYGERRAPPMRWVFQAEARRLRAFDAAVADASVAALFVSAAEAAVFARLVPQAAAKLHAIANGVDTAMFDPALPIAPVAAPGPLAVFTGRMDYWPNVDAVQWFARTIWPAVRQAHPTAQFAIVGAAPGREVLALQALAGVSVTGAVPDVRPYLARADAVVAPLRIARGIQNKVLEGLAMARPVVTTPAAREGIAAEPGREVIVADTAPAFAAAVSAAFAGGLPPGLGMAGRAAVLRAHQWPAALAALDALIAATLSPDCG